MQRISFYWFAAQQDTSTLRQEKSNLFYLKLIAELNEFSTNF